MCTNLNFVFPETKEDCEFKIEASLSQNYLKDSAQSNNHNKQNIKWAQKETKTSPSVTYCPWVTTYLEQTFLVCYSDKDQDS